MPENLNTQIAKEEAYSPALLIPDFPRFIVLNHTHATTLTFESVQSPRRLRWYLQNVAIRIK